jgi:4-amino-4-deoxy-L-arabinose transferase-like glycosyltransferase
LALVAAVRIVKPARLQAAEEVTIYAGAKPPPRRRAIVELLWRAGFGAALGLAVLAKGPAALILAGGSAGLWMLCTRRWRDGLALANPAAILVFCVVALPWYVLCALRNPEFVDVFIIAHNFQRFLTPVFQHEQPFWFFGPILLLGLVPWTPMLIAAARDGIALLRSNRWVNSPSFFIACWAIFPVLFFSASKSKLPGYVLPAIPPLALLLTRSLSKGLAQRDMLTRWPLVATGALLLNLGWAAATRSLDPRMPDVGPGVLQPLSVAFLAGGISVTFFGLLRRYLPAVAVCALCIATSAGILTRTILPHMDGQISSRAVAGVLPPSPKKEMSYVSVFQLHRAWHYGMNYYMHQEIPVWSREQDTQYIVTTDAGLTELQEQGVRFRFYALVSRNVIAVVRER